MKMRIIYSEQDIQGFVNETATQVADFSARNKFETIVFIVVLYGSTVFSADFLRCFAKMINLSKQNLKIHVDYIRVSRYDDKMSGGQVNIDQKALKRIKKKYKGLPKIILEEIVDHGQSIETLFKAINEPKNTLVCTLINKTVKRENDLPIHFFGTEMKKNHFLAGYGMDYKRDQLRELPYIVAIEE